MLTGYLSSRHLLIVLDNCEHVISAAAEVVDAVLRAAPDVRIIATSREPLNVPGEISWRVPSLSLGDEAGEPGPEASEAMALFEERAREADPTFRLTAENRLVVATICRRLDGLPLAIELAAARVRAFSVEEIANRLQDRFSLLTGGARTALPRQRTLEAAVAWSYDLLDDDERRLFARLSIFAGTFDLSAAEQVGSGGGIGREQILDLLPRLVDKSLLSALRLRAGMRYRLLETLRDYGRGRLSASADAKSVPDAHTAWALAYAELAGRQLSGPEQGRWLEEVRASMDDIRSALERTLAAGDRETGLRIMIGLTHWWPIRAAREARQWLEQLLTDERAVSPRTLGLSLSLYGVVLGVHGLFDRSADTQKRALALLRDVSDERGAAWAMHYLAITSWTSAEPAEVKKLTREALAGFEQLDEPMGMLRCLWWMILWELEFGDLDEALRYGSRLQDISVRAPGPLARAHAAEAAGLLARVQGDLDEAGSRLHEAVDLHAKARNPLCLSHCLEHVALWSLDSLDATHAATLLGAVDAIREDVVGTTAVPPFERMWHDRAIAAARDALGAVAYDAAWTRGRRMSLAESTAAGLDALRTRTVPPVQGRPA